MGSLPNVTVHHIGYDGRKVDGKSMEIEEFDLPVSTPSDDEVLVHVTHSSINPVDWKLTLHNWFQRKDQVPLGCDIAGRAVKVGKGVTHIQEGDEVFGIFNLLGNGVFATGGQGSYQTTYGDLLIRRDTRVSAEVAGAIAVAMLAAYDGIRLNLKSKHKNVYIPGGAGGVAHVAIQYAKTHAGVHVVSSASRAQSSDIAKKAGSGHVFNYKNANAAVEVAKAFGGSLADFVFDSTCEASSHLTSAQATAQNGTLVILGATLPDTSQVELYHIIQSKNINLVHGDVIRYYTQPEYIQLRKDGFLRDALNTFQNLYTTGEQVKPYITNSINATADNIRAALEKSMNGKGLGKEAVRLVY